MKSIRHILGFVLGALLAVVLAHSAGNPVTPSDAQKSFDIMKTLAGTWQGTVNLDPKSKHDGDTIEIKMRVTSRGNALVHEGFDPTKPDDPGHYDHPLTMFYVDESRLLLTHYCDAGNRPRMVARSSPDGKRIEFDFLDLAGSNQYGHMAHAVFTLVDADHHAEDWTYMMPGDKPQHAHFDLTRVQ
jgi:hypothetical protein